MSLDDETRQLDTVRRALVEEFAGRVPSVVVDARFAAIVGAFEGAPIRTFVPVLAQRQVRRELLHTRP